MLEEGNQYCAVSAVNSHDSRIERTDIFDHQCVSCRHLVYLIDIINGISVNIKIRRSLTSYASAVKPLRTKRTDQIDDIHILSLDDLIPENDILLVANR